ncbi:peptidoglycan bridge formation glycyltransferase FemA/FemB family protein [Maribacter algicola]|uniref:Peptidoglycan bridge formation glycyltransferase FemA/FemB family protein n=1 Tax=Maribacter algicola TaxID=2498892 RepID=A0A426RG53_9FLAO|nr:GNAT family N-acetyltransferase [Maribacter algicola]RRQ47958.1 peptidoglycan bridge formation glycyltransferase FemA/FemB family protein [Maribacter algicola]
MINYHKNNIDHSAVLEVCLDSNIWNSFLEREMGHQMVTIAHNPCLGKILEKTFGYTALNYAIKENEQIIGLFPTVKIGGKVVSMPHFSYGGPLVKHSLNREIFIENIVPQGKFEIRSFERLTQHVYDKKISCVLKLYPTAEEQIMSFKSKLRQKLRKSANKGFTSRVGGLDLLDDFYDLYSNKMLKFGSPPIGKVFYRNLLELYEYGKAEITVLYDGVKVIAAGFSLSYLNFNEICWSATDCAYDKHNLHALICWEMMKDSIGKYDYFSFGRSTKESNNHRFKLQWNPIELPIYYNFSEPIGTSIKDLTFLTKIWKLQPLRTSVFFGHYISKYVY